MHVTQTRRVSIMSQSNHSRLSVYTPTCVKSVPHSAYFVSSSISFRHNITPPPSDLSEESTRPSKRSFHFGEISYALCPSFKAPASALFSVSARKTSWAKRFAEPSVVPFLTFNFDGDGSRGPECTGCTTNSMACDRDKPSSTSERIRARSRAKLRKSLDLDQH